ncbi:breast cancer type 1 susceptibility protein [Calypte anna]|uniref:breast cancer type 1 susceptibility protein n=1 Tax=Calypte anna TaxID=9244 RepID=UPI0011C3E0EA|nr:breast cancer type 1 susceptibility protein [Calypte anna]
MALSVRAIGDVQDVLSAMQKNLECPICLDVLREPVSTKCDHIFCRFCMFQLFSRKKKAVIQCPLCKTEVTKRSLKGNSIFKQLAEGLLEAIHAFELDTGVKILNSHCFSKTSGEVNAAEFLSKESSVIQSKGFRHRKINAKENGQENCTLQEANVDAQLTDPRFKKSPPRKKDQKCDSGNGIYIEFGKICSRSTLVELMGNAWKVIKGDFLIICDTSKSSGESDSSKEALSQKSTPSIAECAQPGPMDVTEHESSPSSILAVDLLTEQCDKSDKRSNASPLGNRDREEMGAKQTQCNSKSKEFDVEESSESRLEKSKEMGIVVQSVGAVETEEPEDGAFHGKELAVGKPEAEPLNYAELDEVSSKRLKRSIQKVNEWFSKSSEILSSDSSQGDSAEANNVSGGGDADSSGKGSCISGKTDPVVESMEIAGIGENKRCSKQTASSIKDKIFGKTYKRERKSNTSVTFRDILPTTRKEEAATHVKSLNSSKHRTKRERKTAHVLQPEDFIKRKDMEQADGCPQSVNRCLGAAEKKICEKSCATNESHPSENREGNTGAEVMEGEGATGKKATEKVSGKHCEELELSSCDQKNTKKSSAAKRCRHSTRTRCALQLVVDRNSVSPAGTEPQIESYPSSEEPRNSQAEQKQVRRSRRLQLLSEEMTKEKGKQVLNKRARKCDSDRGAQREVLVHASECNELCEPQGRLSSKPLTNLTGGDLEANEIPISVRNSADTAETGRSLFNPVSSGQHSNCNSFAPETGSQEGETLNSASLLQSPPVPPEQTTSHPAEGRPESCRTFPQDSAHDTQKVPGGFRTEDVPVAKNVLELTKEAEDSDVDTQFLRNVFRHSKRHSFSLFAAPRKAGPAEGADPEGARTSCADERKHTKHLIPESLQEEETAAKRRVCEKLKTPESACVSNSQYEQPGEHQEDGSEVVNQGNLTPVSTAGTEARNRSQKGEQGNEKTVSTNIELASELRQNSIRADRMLRDQSNTGEQVFKRTDLNTAEEICFSSESPQAEKTKVVDSKGPILPFQSRSMIATCKERPPEFSCEVTGKKSSKRGQQVEGDEEQATQSGSTGMPECLVRESLEPPKGNGDSTGLSETPDGLLCSDDDDIEETTNVSRRERSAVFAKSGKALVEELENRNVGSKPRSRGVWRSRRVQKLPSSDEESSEDEVLPCFQALIFGKSASTPLQSNKVTPVAESSSGPTTLSHSGSRVDKNMQKVPEGALSNGCVSPSQESECSVNLFSSQSNVSEESVEGAQELRKPFIQVPASKQVSNVNESKESFPGCNGELQRWKTDLTDECQEDPNLGDNLGEASGYDSETSYVEDSCEPLSQGEILTTQQKNVMQNNLKKLQQEMAVLEAVLKQHGSQDKKDETVPRSNFSFPSENTEQKSRTRQNSAFVLSNLSGNVTRSPDKSSSPVRLLQPQTAEPTDSSVVTQNADKNSTQECELKRNLCVPGSGLHNTAGKENTASPVVTKRKEMSIVASGLSQSERLMVQKFARKTQSTLSNHITEGTTHVIIKTDEELVCERTLKYFLGIAGRKWVVSYQWVIQSFKEGRVLDEEKFEVRGDVINGRNHQGPKKSREARTEKIFKDFEICCYGPFTDMTTEHLEWMVELCGASVVKQLHLFPHNMNSTAVVVVQPDAWMENMDYRAIQLKNNVVMVTREWVLDSVASYECQEIRAYLVS